MTIRPFHKCYWLSKNSSREYIPQEIIPALRMLYVFNSDIDSLRNDAVSVEAKLQVDD